MITIADALPGAVDPALAARLDKGHALLDARSLPAALGLAHQAPPSEGSFAAAIDTPGMRAVGHGP